MTEVQPFVVRLFGAARIDPKVYGQVASDPAATNQAAVVVALSALAQAIGGPERIAIAEIPIALAWSYFSWLIPGTLVWLVAVRVLKHEADLPRVLRCVGFATAPQIYWLLGLLPIEAEAFRLAIGVVVFMMALVANVIAIREAFAVPTLRAAVIFAGGFLAFALLAVALGSILATLGGFAPA